VCGLFETGLISIDTRSKFHIGKNGRQFGGSHYSRGALYERFQREFEICGMHNPALRPALVVLTENVDKGPWATIETTNCREW
jgi:hypothetical protein